MILQIFFLLAVWLPVLEFLELEWRFNEQYHYGYFVPFFTLYLCYLRWDDRPEPDSKRVNPLWLLLPLASLALIQVVETANPDWRLIYWVSTITALTATGIWFHALGGWKWLKHFAPALLMILFAVPWVTSIENRITGSLMNVVSDFTVEVLNLAGIYAVQAGNVILLQNTIVGVEEACSGVRSLQSSLMAGYLFGEIMRFRIGFRASLIAIGVAVTFILNLIRTLLLTNVALHQGPEAFENWHDIIGNVIAISGFLSIALLAWGISKLGSSKQRMTVEKDPKSRKSTAFAQFSIPLLVVFTVLPPSGYALDALWYGNEHKPQATGFDYGNIHWDKLASQVNEVEINPVAVAQLKFSEGNHYRWTSSLGTRWTAFYFYWDEGTISSHAGVHRPENCLPASGMKQLAKHEKLYWTTPTGYEIPFETLTFKGYVGRTHVFFAVWDENGTQPWVSNSWKDRMSDVWHRRLVKGRHSLQFLVENASSFDSAAQEWRKVIETMYAPSADSD